MSGHHHWSLPFRSSVQKPLNFCTDEEQGQQQLYIRSLSGHSHAGSDWYDGFKQAIKLFLDYCMFWDEGREIENYADQNRVIAEIVSSALPILLLMEKHTCKDTRGCSQSHDYTNFVGDIILGTHHISPLTLLLLLTSSLSSLISVLAREAILDQSRSLHNAYKMTYIETK